MLFIFIEHWFKIFFRSMSSKKMGKTIGMIILFMFFFGYMIMIALNANALGKLLFPTSNSFQQIGLFLMAVLLTEMSIRLFANEGGNNLPFESYLSLGISKKKIAQSLLIFSSINILGILFACLYILTATLHILFAYGVGTYFLFLGILFFASQIISLLTFFLNTYSQKKYTLLPMLVFVLVIFFFSFSNRLSSMVDFGVVVKLFFNPISLLIFAVGYVVLWYTIYRWLSKVLYIDYLERRKNESFSLFQMNSLRATNDVLAWMIVDVKLFLRSSVFRKSLFSVLVLSQIFLFMYLFSAKKQYLPNLIIFSSYAGMVIGMYYYAINGSFCSFIFTKTFHFKKYLYAKWWWLVFINFLCCLPAMLTALFINPATTYLLLALMIFNSGILFMYFMFYGLYNTMKVNLQGKQNLFKNMNNTADKSTFLQIFLNLFIWIICTIPLSLLFVFISSQWIAIFVILVIGIIAVACVPFWINKIDKKLQKKKYKLLEKFLNYEYIYDTSN